MRLGRCAVGDLDALLARALGVPVEQLPHHLVAPPSWNPRPAPGEPHGRRCVRVTALAWRWSPRRLLAVVAEAPTEAEALAELARGGLW